MSTTTTLVTLLGFVLTSAPVLGQCNSGPTPPPPPIEGGPGSVKSGTWKPGKKKRSGPLQGDGPETGGDRPSGLPARPNSGAANPSGPVAGPKRSSSPRSSGAGTDLASWQYWWRYNGNPYLDVKNRVRASGAATLSGDFFLGRGEKPAAAGRLAGLRFHHEVAPILRELLATETTSHLLTSSLLALAKFGDDRKGGEPTVDLVESYLRHGNASVSEVAALSLGIVGDAAAATTLTHLVLDDENGRALCDASRVPDRVRAFAAYSLGVLAQRLEREDVRRFAVSTLTRAFEAGGTFDVEVACVLALGLVPLAPALIDDGQWAAPGDGPAVPSRSLQDQVAWCLEALESDDRGYLVVAHLPTTIGRLLADAPAASLIRQAAIERLLVTIGPRSKASAQLRQSAAQALGRLADADDDPFDERVREALIAVQEHEADRLARAFALMSLAQIGGRPGQAENSMAGARRVRSVLSQTLARGKSFARPWAALSIGVMERALGDVGQVPSADMMAALRSTLDRERSPELVGSLCMALGIAQDKRATGVILERLDSLDPKTRVYAVLALGMIEARESLERLDGMLAESKYQPRLVWSTALALALMKDTDVVPSLLGLLERSSSLITRNGVCLALGHVGDASAVTALLDLSRDERTPDVARGMAVEALGIVGERDPLPWNTALSVGTNYAANPATLSDPSTPGVLDIL